MAFLSQLRRFPRLLRVPPSESLKIIKLDEKHVPQIHRFLLKDFLLNEPLNRSVNLKAPEAHDFYLDIVNSCLLEHRISYAMVNEDKQIVGVRLSNVIRRPEDEESMKLPDYGVHSTNHISKFVANIEKKVWQRVPQNWNTLISLAVISVDQNYGGRGIARSLIDHNLEEFKEVGGQGVVTEATAIKSQKVIGNCGYEILHEVLHSEWTDDDGKRIFNCDDGTDRAVLFFKRLQSE